MSNELVLAYKALNEEELKIETVYTRDRMEKSLNKTVEYSIHEKHRESYSTEKEYQHHQHENEMSDSYMDSIQIITDLLLQIENLEENKKQLLAKLVLKEKKWIENDKIFKERRFTLMAVLQYDLALLIDNINHALYQETLMQRRVYDHERYIL